MRLVALFSIALGCVGSITGGENEKEGTPPNRAVTSEPLVCDASNEHAIGPAPMRRLTRTELRNTVRDLFPTVKLEVDLPADSLVDGFDNNETALTASPMFVEKWSKAATALANAAAPSAPCKPTEAERPACAQTFVDAFVPRAYRRPITADERARFAGFVVEQAKTHGFETAIAMLIDAVLQTPAFLYRPEESTGALSGYEVATRLSYLMWQTMPDAPLFDAARAGELTTREGVEKHARRMLADPRAKAAIADFHRQWLQLDKMTTVSRDRALFPAFTDATPAALAESTKLFAEHQFWNGSFESLLTEPRAFVNDTLAPLYGVAKPGAMTLVDLDSKQRAGLLTQTGFLATKAHEKFDAPILRGVFVLERFLCAPPPPPPPDVADIPPAEGETPKTTRQRIEASHSSGGCKNCHDTIHGVGFLFNNYDAVGAWRTTENGIAVDSSGVIKGLGDMDGTYNGAVALSTAMAKSERVKQCFSRQWFRFAHGRTETHADGCAVVAMQKALDVAKGNMREMLVQMVLADAFRFKGGK